MLGWLLKKLVFHQAAAKRAEPPHTFGWYVRWYRWNGAAYHGGPHGSWQAIECIAKSGTIRADVIKQKDGLNRLHWRSVN